MSVLTAVPESVLWMLTGTEDANARLRQAAADAGVAPERIIFADKMANPQHLARYPLADLFLDSLPYGAHTTAADSLWMNVPILTLPGRSFASRVCADLLTAAGLADMVCDSPDAFVARAIELGRDPAQLAPIKARLAKGRDSSTLFDTARLVDDLEGLYKGMWRDFVAGDLPVPDLRNLEIYQEIGLTLDIENIEILSDADYAALYREKLAEWDAVYPVGPDGRLLEAAGDCGFDPPGRGLDLYRLEPRQRPKTPVPLGQDRTVGVRPGNRQIRIVPAQAVVGCRRIGDRDQVEDLGRVRQRLEPVREADRNIELPTPGRIEFDPMPVPEGRRAGADIDDDIEDGAGGHPHQLGLAVRRPLQMQAAQGAFAPIEGVADLVEMRVQPGGGEGLGAEQAAKLAALVAGRFRRDQHRAGKRRLFEDHSTTTGAGSGRMNRPPHSRMPAIWAMISSFRFQGRIRT